MAFSGSSCGVGDRQLLHGRTDGGEPQLVGSRAVRREELVRRLQPLSTEGERLALLHDGDHRPRPVPAELVVDAADLVVVPPVVLLPLRPLGDGFGEAGEVTPGVVELGRRPVESPGHRLALDAERLVAHPVLAAQLPHPASTSELGLEAADAEAELPDGSFQPVDSIADAGGVAPQVPWSAGEGGFVLGLSARTVRYIHTIIGRALREAVDWERLIKNVAPKAGPPSASAAKSPEMKTWDAPTLARFLHEVREDRHQPTWLFLATTGCRRGESLGIRWADVDLDKCRVLLFQTISAINHEIVISPRTKSGKPRPIEIDAATVASLRAVRKRQAQERLLLGPDYKDHDLVFARPDGTPQHPEHLSNAFDRRIARYKLPRIRLHDLRHTWATLALQAGVDVKIVSERLGHTSTKITWDIYQHVTPVMQSDAAETVARLIFGPPGQTG